VIVPEEPQLALARGAALASAKAPRFDTSTIGLAYSQDPDGTTALLGYEDALLDADIDVRADRKPFALGGALTAVFAMGMTALTIAMAVNIQPNLDRVTGAITVRPSAVVPPPAVRSPQPAAPLPPPARAPDPAPAGPPPVAATARLMVPPAPPPTRVVVRDAAPAPAAPPPPPPVGPPPVIQSPIIPWLPPILQPPRVYYPPVQRPWYPAPRLPWGGGGHGGRHGGHGD
jgi:hypothetical protein